MTLYKIFGFAVLGVVCTMILKRLKEEYAVVVSLLLGLGFTACAIGILQPTVAYMQSLCRYSADNELITLLFKSAGIAVITTLAANLCRDCGETALAGKTELCGKSVILALCLPLLQNVLEQALSLIS